MSEGIRIIIDWTPPAYGPKTIFFYSGSGEKTSFLSNFATARFEIDGHSFSCVEQYFQWAKMKMFGRDNVADKILAATSPSSMKSLARRGKGALLEKSELEAWEPASIGVMRRAVEAKFFQNPRLMEMLLDTGDSVLVERLPSKGDKKWGVGKNNQGRNLLGITLMGVRAEAGAVTVD